MSNPQISPAYLALYESGELARRAVDARKMLAACTICPRRCEVDRDLGRIGHCKIASRARVASYGPHFGEEQVLVGRTGSGAVFFEGCSLGCVFCQNADISRVQTPGDDHPAAVTAERLARIMLELQEQGCLNINFVTPGHVVPQILEALCIAAQQGLRLPLVYNSGGYDLVETLHLLDGVIDIYMPDCKFMETEHCERFLAAADYSQQMQASVREMHRQVGDLELDEKGRAVRGLLVRHLVMPGCLEDTRLIMEFLAGEISQNTYVNIMDQYHPCYRAAEFPEISRPLDREEFVRAEKTARKAGLHRFAGTNISRLLELLLGSGIAEEG